MQHWKAGNRVPEWGDDIISRMYVQYREWRFWIPVGQSVHVHALTMYMHDQTYVKLVHVEFWGHMLTPLITGVAQSLIQLETHVRSLAQAVNQSSQNPPQTGRLARALGNSICQWATWGEHLQNWNMSPVFFQCVNSDTIVVLHLWQEVAMNYIQQHTLAH